MDASRRFSGSAIAIAAAIAAVVLAALALREGATTFVLVLGALLMSGACWASAARVLGRRAALRLLLLACAIGWLAEQLGASYGWLFGRYAYTAVLGPRLGAVPVVIPLMWFALSYTGYVMANLVVWQAPVEAGRGSPARHALLALVGATVVTCYDLGVDPYMVYRLRAWIMARTDGAWFGETVQGFAGWMTVAFAILLAFRLSGGAPARTDAMPAPATRHALGPVLVPLCVYAGLMLFQVCLGYPVEARTIALFAMGFPLLSAGCGLLRWRGVLADAAPQQPASMKKAA